VLVLALKGTRLVAFMAMVLPRSVRRGVVRWVVLVLGERREEAVGFLSPEGARPSLEDFRGGHAQGMRGSSEDSSRREVSGRNMVESGTKSKRKRGM
jgi:hypothetical protein